MRAINRKFKILIAIGITGLVVFYLEVISYVLRTRDWVALPRNYVSTSGKTIEPLRILIVADPQIQGEDGELPFFGVFTRWDSDSYLKRTYYLAKHHVKPDVVIFLGDLFDEGSTATDPQYRRYYARFVNTFDLPRKQDPSVIKYIFIPGDNDVGGEFAEDVSVVKLNWFNKTFGSYNNVLSVKAAWEHGSNVQFIKYNHFLPDKYKPTEKEYGNILDQSFPTFRVLLSHDSMLNFISESVHSVTEALSPSLILSAHSHVSTYYRLDHGKENAIHTTVAKNFLLPSHRLKNRDQTHQPDASSSISQSKSLRFKMNKVPDHQTIHEVTVPTCSYRMGVQDMGYGFLQIFEDGTADYTVLWLPSRFQQLYIYLGIYILMKIVFTPWVFFKVGMYIWRKYQQFQSTSFKKLHV